MTITTDTFQQHIARALTLLRTSGYPDLANQLDSIHETGDVFEAFTDGYRTYLGNPVAEWPEESESDQIAILATYLGHEATHVRMYRSGSTDWNTDAGERSAMEQQKEIAERLGVPLVYVVCPLQAIPDSYTTRSRFQFIPNPDMVKLGTLAAVAFAGVLLTHVKQRIGNKRVSRSKRLYRNVYMLRSGRR